MAMKGRGVAPFLEPYRFDDAGWVANRWCEILPISQAAKFKLMTMCWSWSILPTMRARWRL